MEEAHYTQRRATGCNTLEKMSTPPSSHGLIVRTSAHKEIETDVRTTDDKRQSGGRYSVVGCLRPLP